MKYRIRSINNLRIKDFQMFERGLPGNDPYNKESTISALPLETCETMNRHWGYSANDKKFKTTRELIHFLVKAAGNNSNLLLNVGPRPDGTIQSEVKELIAEAGKWLRKNEAGRGGRTSQGTDSNRRHPAIPTAQQHGFKS